MLEAIQSSSCSVAALSAINRDTPRAILTLVIADLVEFLNVGMSMSVNQIQMTVEMLLRDTLTKNLKPEDYKVCFDQFKKTGKSFNRIDGQTIFEMVYKYAGERADFVEMNSINQHGVAVSKTPIVAPEIIEMYKEADRLRKAGKLTPSPLVADNVKIIDKEIDGKMVRYQADFVKPEDVKKPERKVIKKSPRDQFIQDCFLEFDKLFDKKAHVDVNPKTGIETPGRWILFNGQITDQLTFTEIKLKAYDEDRQKRTDPDKEAL